MAQKRILLADADPSVAEGFRRALGGQWEIIVAPSGSAAMEELKRNAYDVLVADIDLPEAGGADLLNWIRKKSPQTVRFVLATEAARERVMKDVLGAQQFLAKPIDPLALAKTLERALALDSWIGGGTMRDLVSRIRSFPTIPSLYLEVQTALRSPNATTQEVGSIMAKDMAMMTKLLQVINSAYFGLPRQITDPAEAVGLLGFETVRSMVMAIKLLGHYDKIKPIYFSIDRLWRHSTEVANTAKKLTLLHTRDRALADLAYTAGLMHDLGKVVLAANFEEQYQGAQTLARKQKLPLYEIERDLFGAHHGEIGAYLLGLWGLPLEVLEVAALHHHPSRSSAEGFTALTAVHVADALESETHSEKDDSEIAKIDEDYLAKNHLTEYLDEWRQAVASRDSTPQPNPTTKPEELKGVTTEPKPVPVVVPPSSIALAKEQVDDAIPRTGWWLQVPQQVLYFGAGVAGFALVFVLLHLAMAPAPSPVRALEPGATAQTEKRGDSPTPVADSPTEASSTPLLTEASPLPGAESVIRPSQPGAEPASTSLPTNSGSVSDSTSKGGAAVEPRPDKLAGLRLQGIFYSPTHPTAIVNGQTLGINDRIDGVRVVAIQAASVTLEFQNQRRTLNLK